MAKLEEKKFAYELYMHTNMSQKEIAEKVGVTEHTLSRWATDEEWSTRKAATSVTRKEQVHNYLMQLKELNNDIHGREKKWPTASEADTIAKITRSIEVLEGKAWLSEVIQITQELAKFINASDNALTLELMPHMDAFIQHKAKELAR